MPDARRDVPRRDRDRQVEDLDEEVDLTTDPDLVFVKLVPLAGG
ncbi:hypothetical protein [Actinomadura soli]|nr:hypothetical protein [Actinomadura soli]